MKAADHTGGPAFPEVRRVGKKLTRVSGMTLRDYFAAKAMQGMCVTPPLPHPSECSVIAERAYLVADAMLAAREGGAA